MTTSVTARPRHSWFLMLAAVVAALLGTVGPSRAQEHSHGRLPHDIPDFSVGATNRAIRSGVWSDAATWSAGHAPSAGEVVLIPAGQAVTLESVENNQIRTVAVAGALKFRPEVSTRLVVGTLLVFPEGALEIGTPEAPVAPAVTAELVFRDQPIDTALDPEQYGTGLLGLGRIRMHGTLVQPTFVRVAEEPRLGTRQLLLEGPVTGWTPGTRVVIPDTSQPTAEGYQPQWEESTLAESTGNSLRLSSPLRFDHLGARDDTGKPEFLPHVGNLTRNVIVRSENPSGTRGHTLFTARADVDIRYVLFKDLGRTRNTPLDSTAIESSGRASRIGTNQIGRYALHLHHLFGPAAASGERQFSLIGNAVVDSLKWGITIHNTHFGLIKDNVVYNATGSGIVTEDGSETANVFDHNFVLRVWGTGNDRGDERQGADDWGWEGSGLWFRGPNNIVRNNVVANTNSFAVTYLMLKVDRVPVPASRGKEPSVATNMMTVPLKEFSNNEIYSSRFGITIWNLGASCCSAVFEVPESTFLNTRLWHIGKWGVYGYGSNRVTFDGTVQRGDSGRLARGEGGTAFFFGDYIARNTIIRRADVRNVATGIEVPNKPGDVRDIYGDTPGTLLVENSVFQTITGIYAEVPWAVTGGGRALPPRTTTLRNVRFERPRANMGDRQPQAVFTSLRLDRPNVNAVVPDRIVVEGYNGNASDRFRIYYQEQAPDSIVPAGDGILGAPAPGLTNAEAWSRHKVAVAGSVAPCTTRRPEITGFVCPLSDNEVTVDSRSAVNVPAAPKRVQLSN